MNRRNVKGVGHVLIQDTNPGLSRKETGKLQSADSRDEILTLILYYNIFQAT
jgi:hypothetical protein